MDLVVAGTDEAVLMVECGANEVPEAEILDALDIAHSAIKKLCAAQVELQKKAGKPKQEIEVKKAPEGLIGEDRQVARQGARRGHVGHRQARAPGRDEGRRGGGAREVLRARPTRADYAEKRQDAQLAFDALEKKIIRQRIAVHKKRPDGRSEREIRQITIDVKPLPRTHGSALFTRGQTQALSASSRSARRARRCAWTTSVSRRPSATSTTTTSRPSPWARPASCAAPSAATSATARSPSARWSR